MSDYKQTRDAAAKVTAQYEKMLRNLGDDDLVKQLREHAHWGMPVEAAESIEQLVATCEELEAKLDDKEAECRHLRGQVGLLEAKLSAAERRERQLLDTTATCRMLRRELNTAKAKLAEVDAERDAFASNIPDAAQNLIRNAHTGRLKALHRAVVVEAELAEVEEERDDALIALASARKQLELYIEEGSVMAQKLDAAAARIEELEAKLAQGTVVEYDDGSRVSLSAFAGGASENGAWSHLTLMKDERDGAVSFRHYTADGGWCSSRVSSTLADRIEELETLLAAARHDAQEAEAYAEALEAKLYDMAQNELKGQNQ